MTMLLQGSGSSPSAKAASNNSSAHDQSVSSETGSLLWFYYKNKNIRFWLPIVVLLNSCLTYVFFVRGSQNSPVAPILPDLQNSSNSDTCDLSKGEWIFNSTPPLYTNSTCDQIQLLQNCLGNGRPDTCYLHWRWRPHNCELLLFDPATFLELMRAKSMLFFGDSLARNHMQSLLCSLSPRTKDVKWEFQSYNFTLAIVWSPFLVKHVKVHDDPLLFNLHLDVPHPAWWPSLASYDFAVMSTSQWFFRPSIYTINNTIFGCNKYSHENYTDVHFLTALELAFRTSLRAIAKLYGYKGTTFLRTASPDHFEHGTWSNGGTCNRTRPTHSVRDAIRGGVGEVELPWLPSNLNRVQRDEARKFDPSNGSRLRVLDVTYSTFLRPDGHPGHTEHTSHMQERSPATSEMIACTGACPGLWICGTSSSWNQ
ncbi:hypothetical protein SELMODRAFT_418889 [Selaginella moellendorffii]|uniref:Uncharacterized protein n=1 Tax=Selaginella moellendorffii TaxID=88036 RepID=D8S748_SELML|nr:hypothetical protein SELMODRAFT_418889 [Selaginella moellendorffii]